MVQEASLHTVSSHQSQQINVRCQKTAVGPHKRKQLSPNDASWRLSGGEGLVSCRVGGISPGGEEEKGA